MVFQTARRATTPMSLCLHLLRVLPAVTTKMVKLHKKNVCKSGENVLERGTLRIIQR